MSLLGRLARAPRPAAPSAPNTGEGDAPTPPPARGYGRWPLLILGAAAFTTIWGGWVQLGELCGFGPVNLLPGIANVHLNLAITLPLGMEVYAAYAMGAWLTHKDVPKGARTFAAWSALTALIVGMAGQVAYHLLAASGATHAPGAVTVVVACIPVSVLGMASALSHKIGKMPEPAVIAATVTTSEPSPAQRATPAAPAPESSPDRRSMPAAPAPAATAPSREAEPQRAAPIPAPVRDDVASNSPAAAPSSTLPPPGPDRDAALARQFDSLKATNPTVTQDELAEETGLSRSTISRALARHAKLTAPVADAAEVAGPPARVLAAV